MTRARTRDHIAPPCHALPWLLPFLSPRAYFRLWQVALLHASVKALQALRLAWWSAARHEHIGLAAHAAHLTPSAVRHAALGGPLSAWVEVEVEGFEPGPVGRSAEAMVAASELPLHYATELWVPSHSDHARALEGALRRPAGAPITFRVYGRAASSVGLPNMVSNRSSRHQHLHQSHQHQPRQHQPHQHQPHQHQSSQHLSHQHQPRQHQLEGSTSHA